MTPVKSLSKRFKLSKTVKYCQKLQIGQNVDFCLFGYLNRQHVNRNIACKGRIKRLSDADYVLKAYLPV